MAVTNLSKLESASPSENDLLFFAQKQGDDAFWKKTSVRNFIRSAQAVLHGSQIDDMYYIQQYHIALYRQESYPNAPFDCALILTYPDGENSVPVFYQFAISPDGNYKRTVLSSMQDRTDAAWVLANYRNEDIDDNLKRIIGRLQDESNERKAEIQSVRDTLFETHGGYGLLNKYPPLYTSQLWAEGEGFYPIETLNPDDAEKLEIVYDSEGYYGLINRSDSALTLHFPLIDGCVTLSETAGRTFGLHVQLLIDDNGGEVALYRHKNGVAVGDPIKKSKTFYDFQNSFVSEGDDGYLLVLPGGADCFLQRLQFITDNGMTHEMTGITGMMNDKAYREIVEQIDKKADADHTHALAKTGGAVDLTAYGFQSGSDGYFIGTDTSVEPLRNYDISFLNAGDAVKVTFSIIGGGYVYLNDAVYDTTDGSSIDGEVWEGTLTKPIHVVTSLCTITMAVERTDSMDGFMSANDKALLNGLQTSLNNMGAVLSEKAEKEHTHPYAGAATAGGAALEAAHAATSDSATEAEHAASANVSESAKQLAYDRLINNVAFNGTANITVYDPHISPTVTAKLTASGWYRIAEKARANSEGGAVLFLNRRYNADNGENYIFAFAQGYQRCTLNTLVCDAAKQFFTKLRYVYKDDATPCYLEVYYNAERANNCYFAVLSNDGTYQATEFTAGSVPDGYSVKEFDIADVTATDHAKIEALEERLTELQTEVLRLTDTVRLDGGGAGENQA